MTRNKIIKTVVFILLLAFCCSFWMSTIDLVPGGDIYRILKDGELILHGNWNPVNSNIYSYTMPGHSFVNHEWLSGIIFYLIHLAFGWNGLVIFKILVLLSAFGLLFFTCIRRRRTNFWLVALFSIPAIMILTFRNECRPEIFSIFFTVVFLYFLSDFDLNEIGNSGNEKSRIKNRKLKIYWLIPIQLLWVNMHLFFVVGPALVGGFLLEKIILHLISRSQDRIPNTEYSGTKTTSILSLTYILVALVAVCFINPHGVTGALYPLIIFNNYGMGVIENQPLNYFFRIWPISETIPEIIFISSVFLLTVSFFLNIRKKPVFYFFAGVATAAGGFIVVRLITYFSLIFLPAITGNLNDTFSYLKKRVRNVFPHVSDNVFWKLETATAFFFIAFLFLLVLLNVSGKFIRTDEPAIGQSAHSNNPFAFFMQNNLKGPILNDYDIGSYLIYNFYPKEKVFMYNVPEEFSESFFKNTYFPLFNNETSWRSLLEKYQFNTIILSQYGGEESFMHRRMKDPDWVLVYSDEFAVILVRSNLENQEIINKFRITPETVVQRVDYLLKSENYHDLVAAADILNRVGRRDLGMETYLKIVDRWPKAGKIWMVMGEWELAANTKTKNPLLAVTYLEKAISAGWNTAEAYSYLGAAYLICGDTEKAEQALRKSLKIDPKRADAKQIMKSQGMRL